MELNMNRYLRGLKIIFRYLLFEWPLGLNFSLRDLSHISKSGRHGYAMTSDAALDNISKIIPFEGKKFIDIGSGKGAVVYNAYKLGCVKSMGVESETGLHKIALKNFSLLKLNKTLKSINIPAESFHRYNEFDIFFLFNPFNHVIYEKVMDALFSQLKYKDSKRYIICYGDANLDAILKHSNAKEFYRGICPFRKNRIVIFEVVV